MIKLSRRNLVVATIPLVMATAVNAQNAAPGQVRRSWKKLW